MPLARPRLLFGRAPAIKPREKLMLMQQWKSSHFAARKCVFKQTYRQTRAHLQLALEGIWQGHATSSTLGPQGQGSYQGIFQGISLQHCAGNGPHDYISADSCFCYCCHCRWDVDFQALGQYHQLWQIHSQQMCQECLQYSHTMSILRMPDCPKACKCECEEADLAKRLCQESSYRNDKTTKPTSTKR